MLGLGAVDAAEPAPVRESWRVWLEPHFLRSPISEPIANSQKTELGGGTLGEAGLVAMSKADFAHVGLSWEEFAAQARRNATADAAGLKPVYVRNHQRVIEYAELRSERPIVASAVLAPAFSAQFAETLGPEILLVVPNEKTAFVFPKLASNYRSYAGMVLQAYRETSHPVSLEVFEVSASGFRAVGAFADPAE